MSALNLSGKFVGQLLNVFMTVMKLNPLGEGGRIVTRFLKKKTLFFGPFFKALVKRRKTM